MGKSRGRCMRSLPARTWAGSTKVASASERRLSEERSGDCGCDSVGEPAWPLGASRPGRRALPGEGPQPTCRSKNDPRVCGRTPHSAAAGVAVGAGRLAHQAGVGRGGACGAARQATRLGPRAHTRFMNRWPIGQGRMRCRCPLQGQQDKQTASQPETHGFTLWGHASGAQRPSFDGRMTRCVCSMHHTLAWRLLIIGRVLMCPSIGKDCCKSCFCSGLDRFF